MREADIDGDLQVQWSKGTTSDDDIWLASPNHIAPAIANPMPELKNGMIVKTKEGKYYRVFLDTCKGDIMARPKGWMPLGEYKLTNGELHEREYEELDIVAVYNPRDAVSYGCAPADADKELLWEREEAKKMTLEEIEAELGYSVRIVE